MADLLQTGKSALIAFQSAMATTSHNIANVNTEGYSRQRVDFQSTPGVTGTGSGVNIEQIERMGDQFATARVSAATSAHAEQEVHFEMASRLDNLVATDGISIDPALNSFFNAVQSANADPSSIATREVVVENAARLADRFIGLQSHFDDTQSEINDRTREAVNVVDGLAKSIAEVNRNIISSPGNGNSQQAHDLNDHRDRLVTEMSEYIDVDTLVQADGSMSVFIGKGINLVTGVEAQHISTSRDTLYPERLQIELGEGSSSRQVTSRLQGGIIGGLNEFAENTLHDAKHQLGQLSLIISDEMNKQQTMGVDLNGNVGKALFGSATPVIFSDNENTGTGVVQATVSDAQALRGSDYVLRFDGANFTATRTSDGVSTTSGTPFSIDGIDVNLTGTPAAGDTFVVSATGSAAGAMESLINSADELALAGRLVTSSDLSNLSDARITNATVTDTSNPALSDPIDIVFTSDTTFDVVNSGTGTVLSTANVYVDGDPIAINGFETSINGAARNGDIHSIDPNVNARGDNSNGLAIANMQTNLLVNGTASFSDTFGSLVSRIGSDTRAAASQTNALETLRFNAVERQQGNQGVSLDEEAIDLTRFQQAYQAAAQVITTSETMFQSILGAVR